MINETMQERLNATLNLEMNSSYLYLAMAGYCDSIGLDGFAQWMKVQASEELAHAIKLYGYVFDQQGRVKLASIAEPQFEWNGVLELFEHTLEHEKHVTQSYNELMDAAVQEKDHATRSFLKWFVDEQVEEVATVATILDKLRLVRDNPHGLLFMNEQVGQRVFTLATATAP